MSSPEHSSTLPEKHCRRIFGMLALVMLLGLSLRLWHLNRQGLFFYDEAWYRLTAQTYVQLPQWLSLVFQHHVDPQTAFNRVYNWGFFPDISYKPPYIVLLMLSDCLFGVTNAASGGYVSAILGTVIIGFAFFIARLLTGDSKTGLLAALLAAVSGVEMYYSRVTFPHQFAAFMLTGFCWLYLLRLQRKNLTPLQHFGLGLLTMSILNAHDMMLPIVILLVGFEAGVLLWQAGWRLPDWRKLSCYLLGLSLPVAFWELVTDSLRKLFHRTLHMGYVTPYHQELIGHIGSKTGKAAGHVAVDYGYYFHALIAIDGHFFLLMLGVGVLGLLFAFIQRRTVTLFFFGFLALACLGMITVFPHKVMRLIAPFMPFLIIIVACGFYVMYGWLRNCFRSEKIPLLFSVLMIGFTVFPMLLFSIGFTQRTSGYAAVADTLKARLKPGEYLGSPYSTPLYTFYLQQKVYRVRSGADLKPPEPGRRIAYVVFDDVNLQQLCLLKGIYCASDKTGAARLEADLMPSQGQVFPNPYLAHLPFIMEHYYSFDMAQWLTQNADKIFLDQIRLYAIPAGDKTR